MSVVRIMNAGLEDDDVTDQIVLRGVVDQASFQHIHMAWYQREQGFNNSHTTRITSAFIASGSSKMEDIVIGMRGQRCSSKDGTYMLKDKCYCINGGQRLHAAAIALKERPELKIRLGAKVYFGTTEEIENDMFCNLGTGSVRISASVLVRNKKKKSAASKLLVALTSDPDFALQHRISWDQTKTVHDLMAGYTLTKVAAALHCHKGGLKGNKPLELLDGLDILVGKIGEDKVRTNVIRFFDVIDKCWTVRQLSGARSEARPHMTEAFLKTLARLFSAYPCFWDGAARDEFYVGDSYARKLRKFTLAKYVQPKGIPRDVLYEVLRKQLDLDPIIATAAE